MLRPRRAFSRVRDATTPRTMTHATPRAITRPAPRATARRGAVVAGAASAAVASASRIPDHATAESQQDFDSVNRRVNSQEDFMPTIVGKDARRRVEWP